MKLLNKSLIFLSVSLLFITGLWSVVFYFNMLDEIKKSLDEGLDNYKRQIVLRARTDTAVLQQSNFENGFFSIHELPYLQAISIKDSYKDTLMYMQDANDKAPEPEPQRLLTTAFENDGSYYQLRIINSMVEQDDLIKELFRNVIILYLILMASIILINRFVLQRLWKPFYSFLDQLKRYRIGSSSQIPYAKTTTKEFTDLQSAVNILLNKSYETYEQQKQFTGNASHELQTPLAIANNKLELLIEKGELRPDQATSISEVMDIIGRLARLNKSLLLLSKIENKQFWNDAKVSLNDVIRQCVADMEEIAAFKQVAVHVSEESTLIVKMDVALADTLISNLLRNALFHNIRGGEVLIEILSDTVWIKNTGGGLPLDAGNIFNRFYKTDESANSSGLGLAIAKAICDVYHFSISYQFIDKWHCFRLNFK